MPNFKKLWSILKIEYFPWSRRPKNLSNFASLPWKTYNPYYHCACLCICKIFFFYVCSRRAPSRSWNQNSLWMIVWNPNLLTRVNRIWTTNSRTWSWKPPLNPFQIGKGVQWQFSGSGCCPFGVHPRQRLWIPYHHSYLIWFQLKDGALHEWTPPHINNNIHTN